MNFKTRSTRTHALLGAVLSVALLTVFVNTAKAHVAYKRYINAGGLDCAKGYVETSHGGTGAGYYKSEFTIEDCGDRYLNMAADQGHYKWNADLRQWQLCTSTGFKFNDAGSRKVTIIVEERNPTPACGEGYYRNYTTTCLLRANGWICNLLPSDWHYLPDR